MEKESRDSNNFFVKLLIQHVHLFRVDFYQSVLCSHQHLCPGSDHWFTTLSLRMPVLITAQKTPLDVWTKLTRSTSGTTKDAEAPLASLLCFQNLLDKQSPSGRTQLRSLLSCFVLAFILLIKRRNYCNVNYHISHNSYFVIQCSGS